MKRTLRMERAVFSVDSGRCVSCGICEAVCRQAALIVLRGSIRRDSSRCDCCGTCAESCPMEAITCG